MCLTDNVGSSSARGQSSDRFNKAPSNWLFAADGSHNCPHLHRVSGWDLEKRKSELIRGEAREGLKFLPEKPKKVGFLFGCVAGSQYTIQRSCARLRPTGIPRSFRIREKDHTNEMLRHLHDQAMDLCDFICNLCFVLV